MLDVGENLPDAVFACVGGGSNAIGLFHAFLGDKEVELFGIEASIPNSSTSLSPRKA